MWDFYFADARAFTIGIVFLDRSFSQYTIYAAFASKSSVLSIKKNQSGYRDLLDGY